MSNSRDEEFAAYNELILYSKMKELWKPDSKESTTIHQMMLTKYGSKDNKIWLPQQFPSLQQPPFSSYQCQHHNAGGTTV